MSFLQLAAEKNKPFLVLLKKETFGPSYFVRALALHEERNIIFRAELRRIFIVQKNVRWHTSMTTILEYRIQVFLKTKDKGKRWKIVNRTESIKQSGWEYFDKFLSEQDRFSVFRVVKNLQNTLQTNSL